MNLKAIISSSLIEFRLGVGGSQGFQELLIWCRDAVVQLVTRRPQRVTSSLRQLCQSQHGIVAWDRLERNVAVPLVFVRLLLLIELKEMIFVELFPLFGADHANLVVLPS